MISLLKIILFFSTVISVSLPDQKVDCPGLGLSFMIPTTFKAVDDEELKNLEKRGEKAVKEEFNRETLKGWQRPCINLRDSLKRLFVITSITVKEAVEISGSADRFIEETFADGNKFNIQRIKTKLGVDINEKEAVQQSSFVIGGMPARKNVFVADWSGRSIFVSYLYFIKKGDMLFLLSFLGSPKATDNEALANAIEAGKPISG